MGSDLSFFFPEIALALVLLGTMACHSLARDKVRYLAFPTLLTLLAAFFMTASLLQISLDQGSHVLWRGQWVFDSVAGFFKLLFLVGAGMVVLLRVLSSSSSSSYRQEGIFYFFLIGGTLSAMILVSSGNLILFYLAMEGVTLAGYFLTSLGKWSDVRREGVVKFTLFSLFSSFLFLIGGALLYGLSHTIHLTELGPFFAGQVISATLLIAVFLMVAGVAAKMVLLPLHFWFPDAMEVSSPPVATFLVILVQGAGFALFIRFASLFLPDLAAPETRNYWVSLVAVLAAATMTYGNLAALWQRSLRRMFAFSAMAHGGYMLMALAAWGGTGTYSGLHACLFYFLPYIFMTAGAFTAMTVVFMKEKSDDLDNYRGLAQTYPFLALAMSFFLLALLGLPPTGGFSGKFFLLLTVIHQKLYWLGAVAVVNIAISAYYYTRIIKTMYLDSPIDPRPHPSTSRHRLAEVIIIGQMVAVLFLGVFFQRVVNFTVQLEVRNWQIPMEKGDETTSLPPGGPNEDSPSQL